MENIGTLPSGVRELFRANGVDPEGFLFAVTGDMNAEGDFASAWLAFDQKGIYVATGAEELIPVGKTAKKKAHALTTRWRLDSLVTYPMEDFDSLIGVAN